MSKSIIVTGAAGFIGRNTVAELNRQGYQDLILVDTLGRDGKRRNLRKLHYDEFLAPQALLSQLDRGNLSNAAAIVHLGACSSTTETDADYLLENNYRYTRRLCEFSLEHGIRFIYASSAATYGDGGRGYSDDEETVKQLRPLNMYGYSKQMFDLWALKSGALKQVVGLKYFNVFGPFEDHKGNMQSVVAKSYRQIRDSGKVQLFKSYNPQYAHGEQMRDFVYVKDAVAVPLSFLNEPKRNASSIAATVRLEPGRTWSRRSFTPSERLCRSTISTCLTSFAVNINIYGSQHAEAPRLGLCDTLLDFGRRDRRLHENLSEQPGGYMSETEAAGLLCRNAEELQRLLDQVSGLEPQAYAAAERLAMTLLSGGKILACGNGGSAADASHFTTEFVCRFNKNRKPYPAISLATHGGDLTAIGNDYDFNDIFARQIEAFGRCGDILMAFTTSGQSENVRRALLMAKRQQVLSVSFLGKDGGGCVGLADIELLVNSGTTARIQEMHQLLMHTVCELVEIHL
jgi:ADP-L-glycero-D-manno-heptose 6-epimerase